MMKIVIIGTGYVGLVSGTCFAEMGHPSVTCLDIKQERIKQLQQGIVPIYEPGLVVKSHQKFKKKSNIFNVNFGFGRSSADVIFIAVDTPVSADGSADVSQIEAVAKTLGQHIQQYCVIVTKSTVPVGTTAHVGGIISRLLKERNLNIEFDLVSNPEFLKEGNAIHDFMKPDRVVIGVNTERAAAMMKEIYRPFMLNHERLLIMDICSAELAKYAANAMLATRISFMNEMAGLCEELGADVGWIRKAIGSDERIGNKFLYPGTGYGGSCLPKDVQALITQARKVECPLQILNAVHQVNQKQKELIGQKMAAYFNEQGGIHGKTIGILGLSFKPDTDDMREASSLTLIKFLLEQGAILRLYDPIAMPKACSLIPSHATIIWCQSEEEAAERAHALVLMTEWKQFRLLSMRTLLSRMDGRAFFDGRNQYEPDEMARKGFDYFSIGRPAAYAYETALETHSNEIKTVG
ncbi:MAG: UDP-glucose dehydrogenase family protein [Chlamydiales bacterium]